MIVIPLTDTKRIYLQEQRNTVRLLIKQAFYPKLSLKQSRSM